MSLSIPGKLGAWALAKRVQSRASVTAQRLADLGRDSLGGVPGVWAVVGEPLDPARIRQSRGWAFLGLALSSHIHTPSMVAGDYRTQITESGQLCLRSAMEVTWFFSCPLLPKGRLPGQREYWLTPPHFSHRHTEGTTPEPHFIPGDMTQGSRSPIKDPSPQLPGV